MKTWLLALVPTITPTLAWAAAASIVPAIGMDLVAVKGGCFTMGDTSGDGTFDTKPAHEVCVGSFSVGKYEVTQEQYLKVMGENPSQYNTCPTCPVDNVTWNMAQAFIRKLNQMSNRRYRLPTEAEWEFACRGGAKGQKYCGGDDVEEVAWYRNNAGKKTHPVGQKKPNAFGLYDMIGNVSEWVSDFYGQVFYWVSPRDNPIGPSSGWSELMGDEQSRVTRGGSIFIEEKEHLRSTSRSYSGGLTGLRVVLAPFPAKSLADSIPGRPKPERGVEFLPKGGGEPGKAFAALDKAQVEEANQQFQTLDKRAFVMKVLGVPPDLKLTDEVVDSLYESAKDRYPAKTTQIAGGVTKGDLAILYSEKAISESGYSQKTLYLERKARKWAVVDSMERFHGGTQANFSLKFHEGEFLEDEGGQATNTSTTIVSTTGGAAEHGTNKDEEHKRGGISLAAMTSNKRTQGRGACPVDVIYGGVVKLRPPLPTSLTIKYRWERDDGVTTPYKTIIIEGSKTAIPLEQTWSLREPGPWANLSARLQLDVSYKHGRNAEGGMGLSKDAPALNVSCW